MKHSRLFVFTFCCVMGAADVRAHDPSSDSTKVVDKCRPGHLQKVWMSIDADTYGIPAGTTFALSRADETETIGGQEYGVWTLFSPYTGTEPLQLWGTCIDMPQSSGPKVKEYVAFTAQSTTSGTKIRVFAIAAHRNHMNDVKCKKGHKKMQSCKAALRSNVSSFLQIIDHEIDPPSTEGTLADDIKPEFIVSVLEKLDIGAGHAHGTD